MTGGKLKKSAGNRTKLEKAEDKKLGLFSLGTIVGHIKKNWVDVKIISKTLKISDFTLGNLRI